MATQSLEFKSGLDDSKFQQGLKRMETGAQKSTGKISGMMKGIGFAAVGAAAMAAGKAVVGFSGDLMDLSAAAQLDVETFQQLSGVFSQSGTNMEAFTKGMGSINSAFESAKTEAGPAREAFDALGISFEALANAKGEERLYLIADAYAAAADKGKAHERVLELVGTRQKKLAAALVVGGAEIRKMGSQVGIATEEQLAKVDALGDAATRLKIKALAGGAALTGMAMGGKDGKDKAKARTMQTLVDPVEAERLKKIRDAQLDAQKEGLKLAIATGEANIEAAQAARDAAREALAAALSGQRAAKPSATERRVARMMNQFESPQARKEGLALTGGLKSSGGLNPADPLRTGGYGLGAQSRSMSARSGSGKALKAFQEAQAKNKAAEEAQKMMVETLKNIDKGINGT